MNICVNCRKVLRESTELADGIDGYVHMDTNLFVCYDYQHRYVATPIPDGILYVWGTVVT